MSRRYAVGIRPASDRSPRPCSEPVIEQLSRHGHRIFVVRLPSFRWPDWNFSRRRARVVRVPCSMKPGFWMLTTSSSRISIPPVISRRYGFFTSNRVQLHWLPELVQGNGFAGDSDQITGRIIAPRVPGPDITSAFSGTSGNRGRVFGFVS